MKEIIISLKNLEMKDEFKNYSIGDEVKVIVKAASKINHTVDFEIKK